MRMALQFASFYMGESLFGIDVLLVREINKNLEITPVDPAPQQVRGLLNLRGQIVTVLDLGTTLGLGPREITDSTCCIVLKTNAELAHYRQQGFTLENTTKDLVGLLVDKIGDMVSVETRDIEPPPANVSGVDGKFLAGVLKLEQELLVTLRLQEVLALQQ
jgi:purine-binding chemotaxis protein CheW